MQIASHLFEYTWNLWKSDVQTILQNLSMLSQRNDIDSILEQSNDLILICDRWLLCLKIIRQLIFSGYASDSTTAQVFRKSGRSGKFAQQFWLPFNPFFLIGITLWKLKHGGQG